MQTEKLVKYINIGFALVDVFVTREDQSAQAVINRAQDTWVKKRYGAQCYIQISPWSESEVEYQILRRCPPLTGNKSWDVVDSGFYVVNHAELADDIATINEAIQELAS